MKEANPREADYFRLRAEWLRFKNHVFDSNTELPTLAAVMDDVRRLMEERGSLGVIYLDLAAEPGSEAARGWQAYDELLRGFARALLSLKAEGGPLSPTDIVAVTSVRSDKFLIFMRAGEPGGIDAVSMDARARRLADKLTDTLPRFLPSARSTPVPFQEGHAVMYRDPMLRAERSMHRALDEAMFMSLTQRTREDDRRIQGLDEIIGDEDVVTLYQPIVDLRTLDVLGHEVFSRGPAGGPFEDAERLFALAERTGRLLDLERLCRNRALDSALRHLRPGTKLFLNTSAPALADPAISGDAFVRLVERQGLDHSDVVLEITERVALEERQAFRDTLRHLKREGFGIAIDDMGSGYSSLKALVEVEPDYLKFDISLVRDIDRSLIKRSLLETLVDLSSKIGAKVIAEGIEMEPELATLREMGVPLGQGRFLGPPVLVSTAETAAS
ncbi:MAG TPA: EAL domain-containing protein [Vicinamibacteria bacterium]|nr:EAL domain-containing protein [Vicinamibacteria bacterium]